MGKKGIFEYINLQYQTKTANNPPYNPYKIYMVVSDTPGEITKTSPVGLKLLELGFKWIGNGFRSYENKMTTKMFNGVKEINDFLKGEGGQTGNVEEFQNLLEALRDQIHASELPLQDQTELEVKLNNVIKKIADTTEQQADALFQQFLNFSSRFHTYTQENQALIFAQDPNATKVKGPRAWEKLGRRVIDNQKSITINCGNEWYFDPVERRKREYTLELQNADKLYKAEVQMGSRQPNQNRDNLIQIRTDALGKYTTYDLCGVYDIANTEGADLPPESDSQWNSEINVNNDNSAIANELFRIAVVSLRGDGISVTQNPATAGEAGWSRGNQINISPDVTGTYALSTIIKQWAGALLTKPGGLFYSKLVKYFEDKGELTPANIEQIKRVEESTVAAAVCAHYNLPTDEAPKRNHLLAAQGGLSSQEVIRENVTTISKVSSHIVNEIDRHKKELDAVAAQAQPEQQGAVQPDVQQAEPQQ